MKAISAVNLFLCSDRYDVFSWI